VSDIKVLFAQSGNRCAFPKCPAALSDGDTPLGEICHIKGTKQGAARHDPHQTPEQRHSAENLILLCPNHHAVIDADEESYTVERLKKMKADHEARSAPVAGEEVTRLPAQFLTNSVASVGQSGGISANTIHARDINLGSSSSVTEARRLQALENLWKVLRGLKKEFGDLLFVDSILLANEFDEFFKRGDHSQMFAGLLKYATEAAFVDKWTKSGAGEADLERPFVSSRIWATIHVAFALYARTSLRFTGSFKEGRYQNWRDDKPLDQLLRAVLPGAMVDEAKQQSIGGVQALVDALEMRFMADAGLART
jgi:hypothetical protein